MEEVVFLKLGGSLITEKTQRYRHRPERLRTLAQEIRAAQQDVAHMQLVLGHGSGSFGHFAVFEHLSPEEYPPSSRARPAAERPYWEGVSEVWYRASQLNHLVMDALHEAGVAAISLAPSSALTSDGGRILSWDLAPLRSALEAGLLPVIFGDIVFDSTLGAKVLSTEALMWHLAGELRPRRILLAGIEEAVWADFPARTCRIEKITPGTLSSLSGQIGRSHGPDVTGGMKSKVEEMLALVRLVPGVTVHIFSGEQEGNVRRALAGELLGTRITSD